MFEFLEFLVGVLEKPLEALFTQLGWPLAAMPLALLLLGVLAALTTIYVKALIEFRERVAKLFKTGVFIELYVRGDTPFISVFRHKFDVLRARSEIYGVVFGISKSADGYVIAKADKGSWQASNINADRDGQNAYVSYFYKPSKQYGLTGITRLEFVIDSDRGSGFFGDVEESMGAIQIVEFPFFRLSAQGERATPGNKAVVETCRSNLSRAMSEVGVVRFSDEIARTLAESMISNTNGVRSIFLSNTSVGYFESALADIVLPLANATVMPRQTEIEIKANLISLANRSHAKYSHFPVAAAVVDQAGGVHYGVNVENASYPLGTCAEQSAISAMVLAGGKKISKVFVAAPRSRALKPCGGCLQRIAEFATDDCEVITIGAREPRRTHALTDLLPQRFKL